MMIKYTVAFIGLLLLSSCSESNVDQISDSQDNHIIIDVRSAIEYQTGHLEGAINIPHTEIEERISTHVESLDSKILLYCGSGKRSGIAQEVLLKMGYENAVNGGGYESLKSKGYK